MQRGWKPYFTHTHYQQQVADTHFADTTADFAQEQHLLCHMQNGNGEKSKDFLFSRVTKELDSLTKDRVRQWYLHLIVFLIHFLIES